MARTYTKLTLAKQRKFLEVLSMTGSVKESFTTIKASKNAVYELRKKNKKFAAAWEEAKDIGIESIGDLIIDCAMGRIKMDKTQLTAAIFIWKGKHPEYRDNYQMNLSGDLTVKIVKFAEKHGRNDTK